MVDDTAFPVFVNESNIKNIVTCTGKTETPTDRLLHGAHKNKVQPQKETLSECKVHTRKSYDNHFSFNSYETSNVIVDETVTL